jgi:hypothetical protein
MRISRFPLTVVVVVAVVAAVAAMGISPAFTAAKKTMPTLMITLTDKGIMTKPTSLTSGDYKVTLKNMTTTPRGIEMTGLDRGGSVYVRYSKILPKNKTEMFDWYFPKNDTAYVKDLLKCEHAANSCVVATFGRMTKAIHSK